jgi:hypothetical protein
MAISMKLLQFIKKQWIRSKLPNHIILNKGYFVGLSEALGENLHLCLVECDNQIISAGLYSEYNRIVQAHWGD